MNILRVRFSFTRAAMLCIAIYFMAMSAGCRRGVKPAAATSRPASETIAAPAPSEPRDTSFDLIIDGHDVRFPAAHLRAWREDNLTVLFYTGEQRAISAMPASTATAPATTSIAAHATTEGYSVIGNALLLQMPLEIDDIQDLPSAAWRFQAATTSRGDDPNGIFLNGNRQTLQPLNMKVTFTPAIKGAKLSPGSRVNVSISGQFALFEGESSDPVKTVVISGVAPAVIDR